jgi:hypothetical protein
MFINAYQAPNLPVLRKKWEPWLKGLSESKKSDMAVILENQLRYVNRELLKEGTTSTDAGVFQKVILPVVRRVYPRLVSPELVGMQPMTGPNGTAIFLRYYYEQGIPPAASTPTQLLQPQGNDDGRRVRFREYEGMMFLQDSVAGTGTNVLTADFTAATVMPGGETWATWAGSGLFRIKFNISADGVIGAQTNVVVEIQNSAAYDSTVPTWSARIASNHPLYSVGAAAALGVLSVTTPAAYTQAGMIFTVTSNAGGGAPVMTPVVIDVPGAIPGAGAAIHSTFTDAIFIDTASCPLVQVRGLENQAPASLSVRYETHPITAETYKLQAKWSLEANQDISNLQGESLEELLANLMTQELSNETDYLIVRDLLTIAGLQLQWNRFPGVVTTTVTGATGNTTMPAYRGSIREHWESLAFAMNDLANSIHTRILRGPANFAVCSPDVSTILESYPEFKTSQLADIDTNLGIAPVGSLQARYKVYKDARLPKGTMLMGYKGSTPQDTGYMFCPYVPATLSAVVVNPTTYEQSRFIMTRFGRTTLLDGNLFYARLTVTENNFATSDWIAV